MSYSKEIAELNEKFHSKALLNNEFYEQLIKMGFNYKDCLLVSIFPDGDNTYCGKLINQDGKLIKFDVDLDDFQHSAWTDVSSELRNFSKTARNTKSPSIEAIAFDIFLNSRKNAD